jgi:DNA-binding NarL/FixJ family response regulator
MPHFVARVPEMKEGSMVTVGLADDHVVVRQGLRLLLESDQQFVVVGEAADGLEAIQLVKRRKPMVLVLDLMMPGLDGLEVIRRVSRMKLRTRVIMLTMYGDEACLLEALKGGAAGYVVKESCGTDLFEAIRVVAAGGRYLSPAVVKFLKKVPQNTGQVSRVRGPRPPRKPVIN